MTQPTQNPAHPKKAPRQGGTLGKSIASNSKEMILVLVLAAVVILLTLMTKGKFISPANLKSMAYQLPEFGFIALGMMIVVLTGGINLSVVNTAAMSSIVGAMVISRIYAKGAGNATLALLAGIAAVSVVALLAGSLNGISVAFTGVTPMLVTLATMMIFEGIGLLLTKGGAVSGFPENYMWIGSGSVLGVPFPMVLFAVAVIVYIILLEHTAWGKRVYMVGCNPTATHFSGVNNKAVLMRVYLISAGCGIFAALLITSRYNSAKVDYGSSYMMKSIVATVLGGTDITGGYGKVIGTVTAVFIIQAISSGLNLLNVNRFLTDVIMGGLLLLVLIINFVNFVVTNERKKRQAAVKAS